MTRQRILIAAGFVLLGLVGFSWLLGKAVQPAGSAIQQAIVLPEPRPLPDFRLVDDRGTALTTATLRGRWTLLFFGFTHCPDICPATLQQLALARRQMAADGVTELPEILLISVDPGRDTPDTLAAYVAHFGDGVTGATGEPAVLGQLARSLGIHFEVDDGEPYTVSHSPAVLVIDPQARQHALFTPPHDTGAFAGDLAVLMAGR